MKKIVLLAVCALSSVVTMAQLQTPDTTYFSPNNGSTVVDVNVRLTWQAALGGLVTGYDVELDKSSSFTSAVNVPVTGTSAKTADLDYNTTYYWRVRAKNTTTTTAWSAAYSFTTFKDQFVGLTPSSGSTNRNPQFSLRWDTVPGTLNYIVELDVDSLFSNPVVSTVLHKNSAIDSVPQGRKQVSDLTFGQKYFWRVKASHSKDESGWSAVSSFTVITSISYVVNPKDNATNVNVREKLRCNYTVGVVQYRFEIDTSMAFNSASPWYNVYTALGKDFEFVNEEGIPYTKDIAAESELMAFGKVYYWRVQGIHNKGVSSWSVPRSFTTKFAPELVSPVDGAVGVDDDGAIFYWKKMRGIDLYQFEYDHDMNFSNPTRYTSFPDTSASITNDSIHIDIPYSPNKYYWRVRAYHTKDTSNWSSVFSFNNRPTGISLAQNKFAVNMFPNPSDDVVYIDVNGNYTGQLNMKLYNVVGEQVDQRNFGSTENKRRIEYDLSTLQSGIYLMNFEMNGESITRRLTVK